VTIVERRQSDSTTFLRVDSDGLGGWAFDVQPGESRLRMTEVSLDSGFWCYRVASERGCALRSRCSTADSSRLPCILERGAFVRVSQRTKVGDTNFLRLQDGSGWVFDRKDGRLVIQGPLDAQPMGSAPATVVSEQGVHLLKAPTREDWAMTKMVLLQGARVELDTTVEAEGVHWMEVTMGTMQGWVPAASLSIGMDVSSAPSWSR